MNEKGMAVSITIDVDDHPHPDKVEDYDDLEDVIEALGGMVGTTTADEFALELSGGGFSKIWAGSTFWRARHFQGNNEHVATGGWSRDRLSVATLHAIDYGDVGSVLEADDARLEAEVIYCRLYETPSAEY